MFLLCVKYVQVLLHLSMIFSIVNIYHKFLCIHDRKIPKKIIHNYMTKKCMVVYGLTQLKDIYGHDKKNLFHEMSF